MMPQARNKQKTANLVTLGLFATALVLVVLALVCGNGPGDVDAAALKSGERLGERLEMLDRFTEEALSQDPASWMKVEGLPDDMVIYRYVDDTLQSWSNQFSVYNDDIRSLGVFYRLYNLRSEFISPLSTVGEELSFQNFGPKWYLVKSVSRDKVKLIAGLEIMDNNEDGSGNGVNRELKLDRKYSIKPLSYSGGTAVVSKDGTPLFKIIADQVSRTVPPVDTALVWTALLLFLCGSVLFLYYNRSLRTFLLMETGLIAVIFATWTWGSTAHNYSPIFSPVLYADGHLFNSLGAILLLNLGIFMSCLYAYMVRLDILHRVLKNGKKPGLAAWGTFLLLCIAAIAVLSVVILKSVIENSNISLELYKLQDISIYTALVYFSVIYLLISIPLLLQMLSPVAKKLLGVRYDALSRTSRTVFSIAVSLYLVAMAGVFGLRKEQNTVNVWANRLAMDRDIRLELQLRAIENTVANDQIIGSLVFLDNSINLIVKRIAENYMARLSQDYDVTVLLFGDNAPNKGMTGFIQDRIMGGSPIAENSGFIYTRNSSGHARYTRIYTYYNRDYGTRNMLLSVEPKSNREDRGYASLIGYTAPGQVRLPSAYDYAKYVDTRLVTFKGNYAYPTILPEKMEDLAETRTKTHISDGDYVHFVNAITDNEVMLITRAKPGDFYYFVAFVFVALVVFALISLLTLGSRRKKELFEKNYYKTRIRITLFVSLSITLIVMALVSILFVYRRNEANLNALMSDRINSIQGLIESRCRFAAGYEDLDTQEVSGMIEEIANTTKTDISLYTTSGKVFRSTTPEIFDRMLLGTRLDEDAYENIVYGNKRYYIKKESFSRGRQRCWFLFAPVFNADGLMTAIIGCPYADESYDFENEAVLHSVTIFTVFILLLLLSRLLVNEVVDKMFHPLITMGRKMHGTDINNLEYIIYERDDEVSTLVEAYNLMVHDLYDSTRQLTQNEREKAWAIMARQVAHEIKNPLTPIKLQLQSLIRKKEKGDPSWEDKFDEVSREILSQIDILAETAGEFSTFAKLYSEEYVPIWIDKLLSEEINLFDNNEDISMSYMGLEGAMIMGPKPHVTRVIVNLLTNAVQALEIMQAEQRDAGKEVTQGRIVVSLRNSSKDGYYDIVFEDNGPGVSDENKGKLFTPNFTTKSNGTGLGLAICRSIIEKCDGEILYTRSFALHGACFTVRYPKPRS